MPRTLLSLLALLFLAPGLLAQPSEKKPGEGEKKPTDPLAAEVGGLKFRSIGPAVTSGRVVGFAINPDDRSTWYVAVACGGVWKTVNAGITWTPIFDDQGSYSIGVVVLDPKSPSTVWVGTGENNSQRSVGYGDGVYRSNDGGKTWKNVGLKKSEHIGRIAIDPRDSKTVYVAAQGPLWGPGGDRGLYKTADGGETWKQVLAISQDTGVTDVVLDARHPDTLLAAAYQRRRHVWTLIDGGPESALYKSTDGGANWRKLKTGLPTEQMGRIGLATAPSSPNVVYAIIESLGKKGGIFRSNDFGETWEKRNDFDQQAQYYAHLVVDPANADRLYVMSVRLMVSDDGGRTLRGLGEKSKHVDNHEIWIDPKDPRYYLVGCDGGIYESFDRGTNWRFHGNLPVTQFYDIAVDEGKPFYHVYGGTQDNFTLGGPARTRSVTGITNADWFVVQGGDGFHCRVDPRDPNTVYGEAQYGNLVRYDRRTGEQVGIQPQPGKGEPALRWNWDSPILISPHKATRIYFAANRLFRSDDRGDTWKAVSGDLTRQIDRNQLPVMGKVWPADTVAKSVSTSLYGNITALAESPKTEGLLYAGTDDGLVQVSHMGGEPWTKVEKFPGVPERTYVSRLLASLHDANTVYAAFDNHKNADFAPYLLKSTDAGKTWLSIAGDLPANGPVLAIAEDHVNPNLLFAGTEFGLYFTIDGGKKWTRLKGGLPTIAVRDLAIQRCENDLVVGTFGRGIYVLDDYTPLRELHSEHEVSTQARERGERSVFGRTLFPVKDALMYIPSRPYGMRGKGFQGEAFYTAENPPFGAIFTYYLEKPLRTLKEERHEAEKEAAKKGQKLPYPTPEQLRAEEEEEPPAVVLMIADADDKPVRTLTGPATQGLHRVAWDLRVPSATLPRPRTGERDEDLFAEPPGGPFVVPGKYRVQMAWRHRGQTRVDVGDTGLEFNVVVEGTATLSPEERKAVLAFQLEVWRLQRAVSGALDAANETSTRLEQIRRALEHTPGVKQEWKETTRELEKHNRDILRAMRGDEVLRARNENTPVSISERVGEIVQATRFAIARPTTTQREQYQLASEEFAVQLGKLRTLMDTDLRKLEKNLDDAGVPWTPGRVPEWKGK